METFGGGGAGAEAKRSVGGQSGREVRESEAMDRRVTRTRKALRRRLRPSRPAPAPGPDPRRRDRRAGQGRPLDLLRPLFERRGDLARRAVAAPSPSSPTPPPGRATRPRSPGCSPISGRTGSAPARCSPAAGCGRRRRACSRRWWRSGWRGGVQPVIPLPLAVAPARRSGAGPGARLDARRGAGDARRRWRGVCAAAGRRSRGRWPSRSSCSAARAAAASQAPPPRPRPPGRNSSSPSCHLIRAGTKGHWNRLNAAPMKTPMLNLSSRSER